eukprot:gnl/TRDRNA2_/TRDRNA2_168785_c0_seq1.p1 gnl/TRDRNA2_/TRDRNA2_168785_c0~~gnl/TRDRNA2_/TRDRNA2_168785_c0_seq1.p1  ORF type:complete len:451 (-),score=96.17 gnl/TRDRNA2_/TRDRNA2_168785_c0_seq1:24-1376(-)
MCHQLLGSGKLSLQDFLDLVEEARVKMRSSRTTNVFHAWRNTDKGDTGALDVDQIMELLKELNCHPIDEEEVVAVHGMIGEISNDSNARFTIVDIEFLVQKCREFIESARRRTEREIQKHYDISSNVFFEFRTQIIELHGAFVKLLDSSENGFVDSDVTWNLLAGFGFIGYGMKRKTRILVEELIANFVHDSVTFPWFLDLVSQVRSYQQRQRAHEVRKLFSTYDVDRSGSLSMKEIFAILVDLGLQPRTLEQQESIAELIEEVDSDGSGEISADELVHMCQRISERLQRLMRAAEDKICDEHNFSKQDVKELRDAFDAMDVDENAVLSLHEVERAVRIFRWQIPDDKISAMISEVDSDNTGTLNFCEFVTLMRYVMEERSALGHNEEVKKSESTPGSSDVQTTSIRRRGALKTPEVSFKASARGTIFHVIEKEDPVVEPPADPEDWSLF